MSGSNEESEPVSLASTDADYVAALAPIIRNCSEEDTAARPVGLSFEPAEKGIVVFATDGRALGAIHDPNGFATRAFRVILPDRFLRACGRRRAVDMVDGGECFRVDLPEWAQPGLVFFTGASATLWGRMPNPDLPDAELASEMAERGKVWAGGYRADPERIIPGAVWRSMIARASQSCARHDWPFSPRMFSLFQGVHDLARRRDANGLAVTWFRWSGGKEPALVLSSTFPQFVGAVMPLQADLMPEVPEFARIAAKSTAAETAS